MGFPLVVLSMCVIGAVVVGVPRNAERREQQEAAEEAGGPERGIRVRTVGAWAAHRELDWTGVVTSTRCVKVGRYYASSSSRYDPSDWEPGGLANARTIVLVKVDGVNNEIIAGDLRRVIT